MPAGVELHAHPGARQGVAQLMGQPGRELRQQPRSLGLADRPLHLAEPDAQVIDRPREVRHLVALAHRFQLAEVAVDDPRNLPCTRRIRAVIRCAIRPVTMTMIPSEPAPSIREGMAASHRACRQLVSG